MNQRSWSSGYDRRLPSGGPGFNFRRTQLFLAFFVWSTTNKILCELWGSNPCLFRDRRLKPAPEPLGQTRATCNTSQKKSPSRASNPQSLPPEGGPAGMGTIYVCRDTFIQLWWYSVVVGISGCDPLDPGSNPGTAIPFHQKLPD